MNARIVSTTLENKVIQQPIVAHQSKDFAHLWFMPSPNWAGNTVHTVASTIFDFGLNF